MALTNQKHLHLVIYNSRNLANGFDLAADDIVRLIYNSRNLTNGFDTKSCTLSGRSTTVEIWPMALTCHEVEVHILSTTVEIWPMALTTQEACEVQIYNSRNLANGFDCRFATARNIIYNSRNLANGFDLYEFDYVSNIYNSRNLANGFDIRELRPGGYLQQ